MNKTAKEIICLASAVAGITFAVEYVAFAEINVKRNDKLAQECLYSARQTVMNEILLYDGVRGIVVHAPPEIDCKWRVEGEQAICLATKKVNHAH